MAKAVRIVTPAPVPTPPPPTVEYTLTLTKREAEVLTSLLGHNVFGSFDGPRGETHRIFEALNRAGLYPLPDLFSGRVHGKSA